MNKRSFSLEKREPLLNYRDTSLIRPEGPRVVLGGGAFSYARGNPVRYTCKAPSQHPRCSGWLSETMPTLAVITRHVSRVPLPGGQAVCMGDSTL